MKIHLPKEAELPKEQQPKCVIRYTAGTKHFIGRSLSFSFIQDELMTCYKRYKFRQGIWDNNLFYPIVKHIVDKNIEDVFVEIIFQSESGYSVLKEELRQLELNYGKRKCLNQNQLPHIPKFKTPTATSKWLTHNEYLNFMKLIKTKQLSHLL